MRNSSLLDTFFLLPATTRKITDSTRKDKNLEDLYTEQNLQGSFSAVSKLNFANKYQY